jgi:hypothetical protein
VAAVLHDGNILDVVENNVNWGGAMAAASELLGYDPDNVARAALDAYDRTLRLLRDAKARGVWAIVKECVQQRVFHAVHPAVAAARGYQFIGDISGRFSTWIRTRWLRETFLDPLACILANLVKLAPG